MTREPLRLLLGRLRRLAEPTAAGGLTDAQLLEHFVARRDEAAFEVLVWRHGPMVLGLCRRLLHHAQDTEDAFQATFLALVRKAGSIGKREAFAGWLYKVAYRVALAARSAAADRAARQRPWTDVPAPEVRSEVVSGDLRTVLDDEVHRLPVKYREAFVLCHLQGKTNEEAARQLGCPKGTVLSRLARAREQLRRRLRRRGYGLEPGAVLTAAVSAGLVDATLTLARAGAAGKAAAVLSAGRVALLTEGVLRAMYLTKLKIILAVVLTAGAAGVGAFGAWGWGGAAGAAVVPAWEEPQAGATPADGEQPAVRGPAADAAARRMQSQNSLKQIGLALHNYADAYKQLPAPAIYGRDGKALLSWRVAILPFLANDHLYKRFNLDEPWDSPHNRQLLADIPAVYAPVGPQLGEPQGANFRADSGARGFEFRRDEKGLTYFQAVVGTGAAFEWRRRLRMPDDFPDGLSNTLFVAEAATPVPWTRPEDLPYVADQALPRFGGLFGGDFNALFGNGSTHFISKKADEQALRAVITRSGGEVINFDQLHVAGIRTGSADAPTREELARANADLQRDLRTIQEELSQARGQLRDLQKMLARETLATDPETVRLQKQNLELKATLADAIQQLGQLRAEQDRLKKELDRRTKERIK
jgi:RNA polymerase sigma factor (sigma-70 family)